MSPKPVSITKGVCLHGLDRDRGKTLCGKPPQRKRFAVMGERFTCQACIRAWVKLMEADSAQRAAREVYIDRTSRGAYAVWAHRALPLPAPSFDQLSNHEREAWRAVFRYFEEESNDRFHEREG